MRSRPPTPHEIAKLLSFLPKVTAHGFEPITRWHVATSGDGETLNLPWPEYDALVEELFRAASTECWCDYDYRPDVAGHMLADPEVVKTADLAQLKTMLTYCVRGERFCDGHWGAMIEQGHIERLLRRLAELYGRQA